MPKQPISVVVALALAASIGFVAGYVFHLGVRSEQAAARRAVFEAQSTQRVLQAYEPVVNNSIFHQELLTLRSLEDVAQLRARYKDATLRSIEYFERSAKALELPSEVRLARPFLQEAEKVRAKVNAAP